MYKYSFCVYCNILTFIHCIRGSFGEQSIFEMYPKLLKRLDDSNDAVRVAVCGTLEVFLQSATNKSCYRYNVSSVGCARD